jgi:uncharacterized protein
MKIQVGGLSQGTHSYQFRVTPATLELDGRFKSDVKVDASLEKTATQIFLRVHVETEGSFDCDRCMTSFRLPLKGAYRMFYVWDGAEAEFLDPSEVQVLPQSFSVVDITDDVRQTAILSVPFKILCQTGCRGLCPQCGKNLNDESCTCTGDAGDVRWEALRMLRNNLS